MPEGPAEVEARFLWLGDAQHSESLPVLQELGITHVLSLSSLPPDELPGATVSRLWLQIADQEDEWLGGVFQRAFDFLTGARRGRGRVLVHSRQGKSRSAGVVVGWLVACGGLSLAKAFERVRRVRPEAKLNNAFWEDLVELEVNVRKISRASAFAGLPASVRPSAGARKGPESIFARFLSASINEADDYVLDSVVRMWAPSEWQGCRSPVRAVLLASLEKLHKEARRICVQFLKALQDACLWDSGHIVARCFNEISRDKGKLAELKLDVPKVDEYLEELRNSMKLHGLLHDDEFSQESSEELDPDRHWFYYPDGKHFSLPAHWGIESFVTRSRRTFRLEAFRSFEHGDEYYICKRCQHSVVILKQPGCALCKSLSCVSCIAEAWNNHAIGCIFCHECKDGDSDKTMSSCVDASSVQVQSIAPEVFRVLDGHEKAHVSLRDVDPPRRGWWVQRQRLESVLRAMVSGTALPPVNVTQKGGRYQIENGFHRYYASIILGYTEFPVQRRKLQKSTAPPAMPFKRSTKSMPAVGWESMRQKRERLEREKREQERREQERLKQEQLAQHVVQSFFEHNRTTLKQKFSSQYSWQSAGSYGSDDHYYHSHALARRTAGVAKRW